MLFMSFSFLSLYNSSVVSKHHNNNNKHYVIHTVFVVPFVTSDELQLQLSCLGR
jgi:hypothetical protein